MSILTDDILSKVDIVDIVSKYVQLKKTGVNYSGLCPFHNEKTPSFVVSPHKQIFKCFGCGEGGNVISFLMKTERMDFRDTVKKISQDYHIDLSKYNNKKIENIHEYEGEKEQLKRMNKLCQQFFLESFRTSNKTQKYLESRGINKETIKKFELGYAPNHPKKLLEYLKKKGFTKQNLINSSLAKQGDGNEIYTFFRDRLTIPIHDHLGNIIAFGARTMHPDGKPKYINTAETILYHKSKTLYGLHAIKSYVKTYQHIIIVEGYPDVMALHSADLPIAVATCGTALTSDHIKILKRYTDHISFLFDNDSAGQQATLRALKIAYAANIFPSIIQIPHTHKDIDEFLQDNTQLKGVELEKHLKKNSIQSFDRIRMYLQTTADFGSPIGKQTIMNAIFDTIKHINSITIQQSYLESLANQIHTNYEIVFAQYKQFCKRLPAWQKQSKQNIEEKKKRQPTIEQLLHGLLDKELLKENNIHDQDYIIYLQKLTTLLFAQKSLTTSGKTSDFAHITHHSSDTTLRRQQELQKYDTPETKIAFIKHLLIRDLNTLVMQHYKTMQNIKEKKELLTLLQQLKK